MRVQAIGLRVQAIGLRVQAIGLRVQAIGVRVQATGFRVQAIGFRVQAIRLGVQGLKNRSHPPRNTRKHVAPYRGTSPIRKRPPPLDPPRTLGIFPTVGS